MEVCPKSHRQISNDKGGAEMGCWDGIKRNEIQQIRRDWPDGLGLEGKEVHREEMTRKGGE